MPGTTGFFWILIAGAVYGSIHSFLTSNMAKRGTERLFGSQGHKLYRTFYNLIALLTLFATIALVFLLPNEPIYRICFPWVVITIILQVLALVGMVTAFSRLSRHTQSDADFQESQNVNQTPSPEPELVTSGLYGWVRHPIYDCVFVFVWLIPSMTWNLLAFDIAITLYAIVGAQLEERKLAELFGAPYEEYRKRTPMFLPIRLK